MCRFDADHSGEIDHDETIGIIECILDGKVLLLLVIFNFPAFQKEENKL